MLLFCVTFLQHCSEPGYSLAMHGTLAHGAGGDRSKKRKERKLEDQKVKVSAEDWPGWLKGWLSLTTDYHPHGLLSPHTVRTVSSLTLQMPQCHPHIPHNTPCNGTTLSGLVDPSRSRCVAVCVHHVWSCLSSCMSVGLVFEWSVETREQDEEAP